MAKTSEPITNGGGAAHPRYFHQRLDFSRGRPEAFNKDSAAGKHSRHMDLGKSFGRESSRGRRDPRPPALTKCWHQHRSRIGGGGRGGWGVGCHKWNDKAADGAIAISLLTAAGARLRKQEREFVIDNLLVRIHAIFEIILVDWPSAMGVLNSLIQEALHLPSEWRNKDD